MPPLRSDPFDRTLPDNPKHSKVGVGAGLHNLFLCDALAHTQFVLAITHHRLREVCDIVSKSEDAPEIPITQPPHVYVGVTPRGFQREDADLLVARAAY